MPNRIRLICLLALVAAWPRAAAAQVCAINPRITVENFTSSLKTGESGTASVLLTVPAGHTVTSVVARLVPVAGSNAAAVEQVVTITAVDGNAIAGIRYSSPLPGTYALYLTVVDQLGCSDATALKREVKITGAPIVPPAPPVIVPPPVGSGGGGTTTPPVIVVTPPPVIVQIPGEFPQSAPCANAAQNSPTGVNPLFWRCDQQAVWNRDYAEYQLHPDGPQTLGGKWMKRLIETARAGGNFDGAMGPAVAYHVTGDPAFAQLAYRTTQAIFLQCYPFQGSVDPKGAPAGPPRWGHTGTDGSSPCDATYFVTQLGVALTQIFSLIDHALTPAQHDLYVAALNDLWTSWASAGFRLNDSDTAMGGYFGFTVWREYSKAINPIIVSTVFTCAPGVDGPCSYGGLDYDPTLGPRQTARNMVHQFFAEMAAGGAWFESHPEYNYTTVPNIILPAVAALRQVAPGHFPEIEAWLQDAALYETYFNTPDQQSFYLFGDNEQEPLGFVGLKDNTTSIWRYSALNGLIAGLTKGTPNGPFAQDHALKFVDVYGDGVFPGTTRLEPVARSGEMLPTAFMYFDALAPRADTALLPKGHLFGGIGATIYHDGWGPKDSMFVVHCPQWTGAEVQHFGTFAYTDHALGWFCNVNLWRDGGWALRNPISYDSAPTYSGHGVNGFDVYRAYPAAQEFKAIVAHEIAPTFVYQAGTTGGQTNEGEGQGYGGPTFFQEWTRSVVYVPTASKRADSIVIFDRSYVTALADTTKDAWTCVQCANTPRPKRQLTFHMPVVPTIAGTVAWTAANGNPVTLATLFPAAPTRTLFDESVIYSCSDPCGVDDLSERKWQVGIGSAADPDFETFLNVFTAGDVPHHETRIDSDGARGAVIHIDGEPDKAFLFNSRLDDARPLAEPVIDGTGKVTYMASNQGRLQTVHLFNHPVHAAIPMDVAGLITLVDLPQTWSVTLDGVNQGAPDDQGVKTLRASTGPHVLDASGPIIVPILSGTISHTEDFSGALSALSMPHTIAPNDNRTLTLGVWGPASDTLQGCTFGSQPFTKLGSVLPASDRLLYALGLVAPNVGTSEIRCTFSTPGLIALIGADYAGASQVLPVAVPSAEQQGAHVFFSASATTTQPGSWLVSFVRNDALPVSAYRNARMRYGDLAIGLFDSAGPYARPGSYTLGVQAGDRPQTQWGALTFALSPAQ